MLCVCIACIYLLQTTYGHSRAFKSMKDSWVRAFYAPIFTDSIHIYENPTIPGFHILNQNTISNLHFH